MSLLVTGLNTKPYVALLLAAVVADVDVVEGAAEAMMRVVGTEAEVNKR